MAQRKIHTPRVICELLKWQLKDGIISGEVYKSRDIRVAIDGESFSHTIEYTVHYPKGLDEDEFFMVRLTPMGDYVKCFVAERSEWPEVLKVFLNKPDDQQ